MGHPSGRTLLSSALVGAVCGVPLVLSSCAAPPAPEKTEAPPSADVAWRVLETADSPMPRHEHGYVAVDGLFYLIGGRGDRPVQVFDPEALTWETRGLPPLEMHHFQAVEHEGRIYVLGAFTGGFPTETPIPHVYIYDPATDEWAEGPEIPEGRRRGAAGVVVHEGRFYVVAGIQNGHNDGHVTWFDSYDPATGGWQQLPDAPHARDHFHAAVIGGKLFAAGGRRSSFATGEGVQRTEPAVDVFDFASGSWSTLPPSADIPTQRAGTAAVVLDGTLVVIGGESGRELPPAREGEPPPAHDEVEAYDPETGAWSSLPSLVQGRHAAQAIVHEGRIHIAAGSRTTGGTEIDTQEMYAPRE